MSKKIWRVGLDLDGIVCDFHTAFLRRINAELGLNKKYEDWTTYNPYSSLGLTLSYTKETIRKMQMDNTFQYLKPISGALKNINKLHKEGRRFVIISDRPNAGDTMYWLNKHKVPYENVYLVKDKIEVLKRKNLDCLVDDKGINLLEAKTEGFEAFGLVHPWNEYIKDNYLTKISGIQLFDDWDGLAERLKK